MRGTAVLMTMILTAAAASGQEKKKVLMVTRLGPEVVREIQAAVPEVILITADRARLEQQVADADGVIGFVQPSLLRAAKRLQWVQSEGAGIERMLTPEFRASRVTLTNCKILQGPEIADHAMALLLGLTRELHIAIPNRARQEWAQKAHHPIELRDKTAVVVGAGGIGTQIAIRAHACGMRVIGVDPKEIPYMPFWSKTVPPDRLDAVLPEGDVVFVSAPETARSTGMIGKRQFDLMKPGAYFIAVSRGKLYDTAALVNALETKKLAGAGLDVTDPEPLPKNHPLWSLENVILTPHVAGRSDGEYRRDKELYIENLRRFAAGEPLLNVVDKEKGY